MLEEESGKPDRSSDGEGHEPSEATNSSANIESPSASAYASAAVPQVPNQLERYWGLTRHEWISTALAIVLIGITATYTHEAARQAAAAINAAKAAKDNAAAAKDQAAIALDA